METYSFFFFIATSEGSDKCFCKHHCGQCYLLCGEVIIIKLDEYLFRSVEWMFGNMVPNNISTES